MALLSFLRFSQLSMIVMYIDVYLSCKTCHTLAPKFNTFDRFSMPSYGFSLDLVIAARDRGSFCN